VRRAQATRHLILLRSLGEPIVGSADLFVELLHHGQHRRNLALQPTEDLLALREWTAGTAEAIVSEIGVDG
jgi:hypothetical protein